MLKIHLLALTSSSQQPRRDLQLLSTDPNSTISRSLLPCLTLINSRYSTTRCLLNCEHYHFLFLALQFACHSSFFLSSTVPYYTGTTSSFHTCQCSSDCSTVAAAFRPHVLQHSRLHHGFHAELQHLPHSTLLQRCLPPLDSCQFQGPPCSIAQASSQESSGDRSRSGTCCIQPVVSSAWPCSTSVRTTSAEGD
jgi:hypothetical protein